MATNITKLVNDIISIAAVAVSNDSTKGVRFQVEQAIRNNLESDVDVTINAPAIMNHIEDIVVALHLDDYVAPERWV